MQKHIYLLFFLFSIILNTCLFAEEPDSVKSIGSGKFTITVKIPATSVKDQSRTSTCWSFSTLSMFESEILRTQKKEYNLSEMYVVRKTYGNKADRYLRMHGNINFSGGGEPNDVTNVLREYGLMPEEAYSGLLVDSIGHVHTEMDFTLKNYMEAIVKDGNKRNDKWEHKFNNLLDNYLGKVPDKFSYKGKEYDAVNFGESLGIDPENYVLFTSFNHHPFYSSFILEVPDNWSWGETYNLPLDELMQVVNYSIDNGYSFTWSTDISEPGFDFEKGIAVVPKVLYDTNEKGLRGKKEKSAFILDSISSADELIVTQEIRQKAFDNYSTTDDHAMHAVGKAVDPKGSNYFYVKNSWGNDNKYQGYMFISEAYFRYKTILVMVNKNAIPANIKLKMNQKPCKDGM